MAQLDIGGEIRAIEFQADDTIMAALRVENGGRIGLVERHRWRTADTIAGMSVSPSQRCLRS